MQVEKNMQKAHKNLVKTEDIEAWNNKGRALGQLGKYDEAIKCYDEAIRISKKQL